LHDLWYFRLLALPDSLRETLYQQKLAFLNYFPQNDLRAVVIYFGILFFLMRGFWQDYCHIYSENCARKIKDSKKIFQPVLKGPLGQIRFA
jgi:hypothetical protein